MSKEQSFEFDPVDLKQFLSAKLYQYLAEIHGKLEEQSNSAVATEILLTALGVNLGHIVGQLPEKDQKKCLKALRKLIDQQVKAVNEMDAFLKHGHVGHA